LVKFKKPAPINVGAAALPKEPSDLWVFLTEPVVKPDVEPGYSRGTDEDANKSDRKEIPFSDQSEHPVDNQKREKNEEKSEKVLDDPINRTLKHFRHLLPPGREIEIRISKFEIRNKRNQIRNQENSKLLYPFDFLSDLPCLPPA